MRGREALMPPPGADAVPAYDAGWLARATGTDPFLRYVEPVQVNWSDELEDLHEHSSRAHFTDVATRRAMLSQLGSLPARATVADLGCSTGHLLADLSSAYPQATLIGIDLIAAGLHKAHALV